MIKYKIGNLFESNAEALVNTVNTVGVMGKGIALQFKNLFPKNYKLYLEACKNKSLRIGSLLITEDENLIYGKKTIINFPTKTSWRLSSEYSYIESGLIQLASEIKSRKIKSIAIPPLGSGNGGLNWNKVKRLLEKHLSNVDCNIYIYEPNNKIKEVLKKERVKLTPARAMLLSVLYDLVHNGEFVSEFAAEKVAYFLQKFGASDVFKLNFQPNFYGPYSGKVRHVLFYLNGSYVMGYSSKDKKPFEELSIVSGGEEVVKNYLNIETNQRYKDIAEKAKSFLRGYYSSFGLELLSSVDYIMTTKKIHTLEDISNELDSWSDRKKTLFSKRSFIEKAKNKIEESFT